MKIFILEDSNARIKYFKSRLDKKGNILEIAKTVKEGEKILGKHSFWDMILLDHDLDGEVFVDSNNDNTGYQLAKFIKQYIDYGRAIIHTMNPAGAVNMKAVLKDAEVIPFSVLDIKED